MPRLHHSQTKGEIEVSDSTAKVLAKSGWELCDESHEPDHTEPINEEEDEDNE